ncbi:hypothetical protein [Enterovibrio calviensis]|uniref:hypothetical protein n=1 Tax=Enterovibrio calviensis TaxID=91359 RepID=UPI0004804AB8|nr:hypothetical protein [Enterovibrio calviensis]
MKIQNYLESYDDIFDTLETQLVDGLYVIERRLPRERRHSHLKYQGYERRHSADRRDLPTIDEYV